MRDKKHRVMTTFVLLVSFLVSIYIFFVISDVLPGEQAYEIALVAAFSIGIFMNTSYLIFNLKSLSHKDTRMNTATQIWFGIMLYFSSILILILVGIFNVDFSNAMLLMAGVILIMIYLTIDNYDQYIENAAKKIVNQSKSGS